MFLLPSCFGDKVGLDTRYVDNLFEQLYSTASTIKPCYNFIFLPDSLAVAN